jgi:hypothetical protein
VFSAVNGPNGKDLGHTAYPARRIGPSGGEASGASFC